MAKVYLGHSPVDFQAREESDRAAGVVRLTDENWDKEMEAWDGDWAIVMCVRNPLFSHYILLLGRIIVDLGSVHRDGRDTDRDKQTWPSIRSGHQRSFLNLLFGNAR